MHSNGDAYKKHLNMPRVKERSFQILNPIDFLGRYLYNLYLNYYHLGLLTCHWNENKENKKGKFESF